jgi:probable blue pigment (indigoidine) exporter
MNVRSRSAALLVPAMLCWGLGTVLTKYALSGFTPLTLLPFQLVCSVTFLSVLLWLTGQTPQLRVVNRRAALLGALNPGVAYALGLLGLARIDASVSVVLWATEPLLVVLLALLVLHERAGQSTLIVLFLAMLGVALIIGTPMGPASPLGVTLTLAAVTACALYSVLLRRMHLTDGSLSIVWAQQVVALLFAATVLTVVGLQEGLSWQATSLEVGAAISAGILYYGVAFWLYVSGLRLTTATRAGMYLTLVPAFGLIFSWALLGERLDLHRVIGAVVVISALAAMTLARGQGEGQPSNQPRSRGPATR